MRNNFVALLLSIFFFPLPLSAQSVQEKLLLIVDYSGSMNEASAGAKKIELARKSALKLLTSLPENQEIGLLLYGHRRAKDCSDIELVQSIKPASKERVAELGGKLKELRARGETPIAESLRQAAAAFGGQPGRLIIVTDGREECGGDVCKAAKALAASEVKLRVDLVGFRLSPEEKTSLSCITEATGGKYYDAANGGQLEQALVQSAAKAIKGGRLRVTVTEGGKIPPNRPIVLISREGTTVRSLDQNPGEALLPADVYSLAVMYGEMPQTSGGEIEVKEDQLAEKTIEIGSGTLIVHASKGEKNSSFQRRLSFNLLQENRLMAATTELPAKFQVRAGVYELKIRLESMQEAAFPDIRIEAGQTLKKDLRLPMSEVSIEVSNSKYAPRKNPYPYIELRQGGRFIYAISDNPVVIPLLEGTYETGLVEEGVFQAKKTITITPGNDLNLKIE